MRWLVPCCRSSAAPKPLLLNVASDDIGPFLSQPPGDHQPEALRRVGDDRDPAFIPATLCRLRERQRLERLLRHGFPPVLWPISPATRWAAQ